MPCDSLITISLKLDQARIQFLSAAMKMLGYKEVRKNQWQRPGVPLVQLRGTDLEVNVDRYSSDKNSEEVKQDILRATSAEIIKAAAGRNGWKLNWMSNGKAQASKVTYGK